MTRREGSNLHTAVWYLQAPQSGNHVTTVEVYAHAVKLQQAFGWGMPYTGSGVDSRCILQNVLEHIQARDLFQNYVHTPAISLGVRTCFCGACPEDPVYVCRHLCSCHSTYSQKHKASPHESTQDSERRPCEAVGAAPAVSLCQNCKNSGDLTSPYTAARHF